MPDDSCALMKRGDRMVVKKLNKPEGRGSMNPSTKMQRVQILQRGDVLKLLGKIVVEKLTWCLFRCLVKTEK